MSWFAMVLNILCIESLLLWIVFLGAVGLFSSVLSGSYVLESSDEDICPRVFGKYSFLEHSLLLLSFLSML